MGDGGHAAAKGEIPIAIADVIAVAVEVTVVATEWAFTPKVVTVKKGEPVTLVLVNEGFIEHELYVAALGLHLYATSGATTRKSFVPNNLGTFELACDLPGDREWGDRVTHAWSWRSSRCSRGRGVGFAATRR